MTGSELRATAQPPATVEIKLPGAPGFERVARSAAAAVAEQMGFSPDRVEDLKTAVSEACLNAMEHGNRGDREAQIHVLLRAEFSRLAVMVSDEGYQKMPETLPEPGQPDRTRGWGLFFITQLMDEVQLQRLPDGGNQIVMTIHLSGAPRG